MSMMGNYNPFEIAKQMTAAKEGRFYGGGLYNPMRGGFQSPMSTSFNPGAQVATARSGPVTYGSGGSQQNNSNQGLGGLLSSGNFFNSMGNPLSMFMGLLPAPGQQINPLGPARYMTSLLGRLSQPNYVSKPPSMSFRPTGPSSIGSPTNFRPTVFGGIGGTNIPIQD
jgi:hypothetical protein